ncbi:MAG TPA: hypothetical protein PLI95_23560, partial [Polyangiaceae bacterium]|nr:hypothetical protein [Polyangiaceae bacterium]
MRRACLLALACCLTLVASCDGADRPDAFPRRDCSQVIWVQAAESSQVLLRGSWTEWKTFVEVPWAGQGWHKLVLGLPAGQHGYSLMIDGVEGTDPRNALTTFRDDTEVSLLIVEPCSVPSLRIDRVEASDDGAIAIDATFLASSIGPRVAPSSVKAETSDGEQLSASGVDPASGRISLSATGLSRGKHTIVVKAADERGAEAEPARAIAWVKPVARSWG